MKNALLACLVSVSAVALYANAKDSHSNEHSHVSDQVIVSQRAMLAKTTKDKGFGPQAPRDIDSATGNNQRLFGAAPAYTEMNLCNIHFHKNAEHKGGEFTTYAGNGDGHGYQSGYQYSGHLSAAERKPVAGEVCPSKHGDLAAGDTIEVHYVHTSAKVEPGATLGSCLSDSIKNPQLRVETQVYVLVNDSNALDFGELTKHSAKNGLHQALNIPGNTGTPVQYAGSTTGPGYNETASPFQVTWSVRPKVSKVNIQTVGKWCEGNIFNEDHAHGVRNLVTNSDLLSKIPK
ncbi:delta-class carbonic anhydrase [Teredinibacter haidensis]|uniref:delta-class carbonic anhydrase n=1 Tax=Teredinibacter haidensis TaxID=2731755 RepID=UPI000948F2BD|nr:delta-class carbonic anhydrase [Teredinibacter haidensis]